MILFDLKCGGGHVFEAWFKDSRTYDRQAARREVICPVCGDTRVEKALMAPRLGKTREGGGPSPPPAADEGRARRRKALREIRRQVEANCDYVGDGFAEEARKIHYGEAEARSIYGEATNDEASRLSEEGVAFQRIPWAPREDA